MSGASPIAEIATLVRSGDPARLPELIPFARWLGMGAAMVEAELQFQLPFTQRLVGNPTLPALHGGVVAGFMENAALLDLLWREAPQRLPSIVNFSLDYLRSARNLTSHASCHVTRLGAEVAQLQVCCWQSDRERPVAIGRAHFLLDNADTAVA